jgi:type I restriction enzyme R subunit
VAQHNEIEFEKEIAEHLDAHGWLYSPTTPATDKERALFPEDVLGWLADTQTDQLEKVVKPGSNDLVKPQEQLLDRMVKVLDVPLENGGGTLNLLCKGFRIWR